jgi:hypothetical protein
MFEKELSAVAGAVKLSPNLWLIQDDQERPGKEGPLLASIRGEVRVVAQAGAVYLATV